MAIFGNTIAMSGKALDFLWAKQQVTANNIANVDTPGYKSKYVTFEETFKNKLEQAQTQDQTASAIRNSRYTVHTTRNESARLDENNVNADAENVELARAGLQYQYLISSINSDIGRLRSVIKGQ